MKFTEFTPETVPSYGRGQKPKGQKSLNIIKAGTIYISKALVDDLEIDKDDKVSIILEEGTEDSFFITNNGPDGKGWPVKLNEKQGSYYISAQGIATKIRVAYYGDEYKENFRVLIAGEPTIVQKRKFYGLCKLPNI